MSPLLSTEIAATAARLVVEEGMEYGPAKRRAARLLARGSRKLELPANDVIEDEIRSYLALFHAETQPDELAALREVAADWMQRLSPFRPHLNGAVWRGTATRHSDVHLELFCDDSKAAELALIDLNVDYDVSSTSGPRSQRVDVLSVAARHPRFAQAVVVHLTILDYDDLRGSLKPDGRGRAQRGDLNALNALRALGVDK